MAENKDRQSRESSIASGWTVEGAPVGSRVNPDATAPDTDTGVLEDGDLAVTPSRQLSNVALVALGLLGGVYLLYTLVWFSWAQHYSSFNTAVAEGAGAVGGFLQGVLYWLGPLAPALWFFSALLLNRGAAFARLVLWLLVGLVVLVPLPMLDLGAAA